MALVGCTGGGSSSDSAPTPRETDTRVEVVVGLARDQDGLEGEATAVARNERPPLTLAQVAERYGASSAVRTRVADELGGRGRRVEIDPTGAFARVQLTANDAQGLFGASWRTVRDGDLQVSEPTAKPVVPRALEGSVTEVIGVPTILAGTDEATADPKELATAPECAAAGQEVAALRARSGLDALRGPGADGAAASVAVLADQRIDEGALSSWLDCIDHPPVELERVETPRDVQPGDADDEIQLDLSALTAALPAVTSIRVIGTDGYDWVADPIAIALGSGDGPPEVISTSVVYCEKDLPDDQVRLAEHVLAAATAVGTTVVAATGDHGSTACAPGRRGPSVAYPASSPFALAVGGVDEVGAVWFDRPGGVAGGGGISSRFADRRVPDVADLAAPAGVPPVPVCHATCAWRDLGGTSFAAPFVAGALARADRARAGAGLPPLDVGLGRRAGRPAPGPTADVVTGSNDLDGVGCCTASPGYDMGSGWGTLRFDQLVG